MRILVCGHRSFAAQGLLPVLKGAGHEVTCFSRGPVGASADGVVTGPIDAMKDNPHLAGAPFDAVINYIVLKDEVVGPNVAFVDSLTAFCRANGVKHLVHISSVSAYKASAKLINEETPVEQDASKKGSYGSLKSSTDVHLDAQPLNGMKLSMVRPGFILGPWVMTPIIGTAVRAPWNKLLVIGNAKSEMPVLDRNTMHEALRRVVETPPAGEKEYLVFSSSKSPTRLKFLEVCCERMGFGTGVTRFPSWMWWCLAVGAETVAFLIGRRKVLKPYAALSARIVRQHFDATKTEQRMGLSFDFDWAAGLVNSVEGQAPNFAIPHVPKRLPALAAKDVTIVGYGRIVKQKYLPWLKRMKFRGPIRAFDVAARTDAVTGQEVQALAGAALGKSDLYVVATPGPAHSGMMDQLRAAEGPMIIEKPLCSRLADLPAWLDFAKARPWPTLVCHNYRYRQNTERMLAFMARYNPGRFVNAQLNFQVAPVAMDSATWMRNERQSRTLLVEYSVHFLDLAMMFGQGAWRVGSVGHEADAAGNTGAVHGHLTCASGSSMNFFIRQGSGPKRCRILYTFQNYSLSLGFMPDTFVAHLSDEGAGRHKAERKAAAKATRSKVFDKLLGRDADQSHAIVMADAANPAGLDVCKPITVEALMPFYGAMLEMAERVYG